MGTPRKDKDLTTGNNVEQRKQIAEDASAEQPSEEQASVED